MHNMLRRRRTDRAPSVAPDVPTELPEPVDPPDGARNLIFVIFDSLRYDTWTHVDPRNLARLGPLERRFSYASWTAPSHYNLLMGLLPHASPPKVYASEYYKQDYLRYSERLNTQGIEFRKLLPSIFLPTFLRHSLGYSTHAMVSMPVLNGHTPINRDFDTYELMPKHNDMAAMLDKLHFGDRPSFHLLNVGETHYPYALPDEDPAEWPRISGAHGVLKRIDEHDDSDEVAFFTDETFETLRTRQRRALSYLDDLIVKLFDVVPENTWIVVTSDHGELFGEEGYFGHGPIAHEKVFEVPFVEGLRP
jgi:hypothetical protein